MKMQATLNEVSRIANEEDVRQVDLIKEASLIAKKIKSLVVLLNKCRGLDKTVTRWQKTTANAAGPLKSYAKQIL